MSVRAAKAIAFSSPTGASAGIGTQDGGGDLTEPGISRLTMLDASAVLWLPEAAHPDDAMPRRLIIDERGIMPHAAQQR